MKRMTIFYISIVIAVIGLSLGLGLGLGLDSGLKKEEDKSKQYTFKSTDIAFYTCFYGDENNKAFKIPDIPSLKYNCYYYTNNKTMLEKINNTKWIGIYDDTQKVTNNIIDSCMSGKHVKTMPHKYKELNSYSYTCFLDSKLDKVDEIFVENFIIKYFIKDNYALLLRKHPSYNNLQEEFYGSMQQERYRLQIKQYFNYITTQLQNGLNDSIQENCACGFLIRNMKHTQINDLNELWYKHIQNCGIQDQISFYFVKQLFKDDWYSFTEIPFVQ